MAGSDRSDALAAAQLAAAYWGLVFCTLLLWAWVAGSGFDGIAWRRVVLTAFAALLGLLGGGLLQRVARRPLSLQSVVAVIVSTVAAAMHLGASTWLYYVFNMPVGSPMPILTDLGRSMFYWTAVFFGWHALFVAQQFSFQVRDRERRVAALKTEAFAAQIKALRYQVNPHFLFNTLNSIATLIADKETEPAERMVLRLSDFLRASLAVDPVSEVPLADELKVQIDYLAIEEERFGDRLSVAVDVAPDASSVLVPSLILQPIIENAVKFGIAAHPGPSEISISARCDAAHLSLKVSNTVGASSDRMPKTGVGLRNVRERLLAHYGSEAGLSHRIEDGLFEVTLAIPTAADG